MVIRGHVVGITVHLIGDAVVAYVHQQEQILAADRFPENRLSLAAAEAEGFGVYQVVVFAVALESRVRFDFIIVAIFN